MGVPRKFQLRGSETETSSSLAEVPSEPAQRGGAGARPYVGATCTCLGAARHGLVPNIAERMCCTMVRLPLGSPQHHVFLIVFLVVHGGQEQRRIHVLGRGPESRQL